MKIRVTFELDPAKNTLRMTGSTRLPNETASILVTNPGAVQITRAMLGQLMQHTMAVGREEQIMGNGDSSPGLILPDDDVPGQSD